MFSKGNLLLVAVLTFSVLAGSVTLSFGQQLLLDTQIEAPPRNNNAASVPEKKAGDTIQFQLFAPGAAGWQIQGYTVELSLRGKTFGSYVDNVSGADLNGKALLSRVSGTGNPTLSMLSLSAVAVPASGYLGQVNLGVSRALTSSDMLSVQQASTAGPGGVQNLGVSQASLSFTAAVCPGDFNGDGTVSLADFLAFAGAFGSRSGEANYNALTDMDGSGAIDLADFLAFAGVFGTTCPVPASPPVSIRDANLRAVIEDSLGKARGAEITRAEMASLTRLEAPNSDIRNLTGLQFATGLTVLLLHKNSVTDLSPLSGLANLTHLNVSSNGITNVSPLTNLTNLTTLRLTGNSIRDISPLSSLTNLTWLTLGATSVSDVSALSSLTRLENLDLTGNRITDVRISDISALSSLTNLRVLHLSRQYKITDFSALLSMRSLVALYLDEMSITDLSWISSLTNLESLGLGENNVADVSPLTGLTSLRALYLNRNAISEVSPLSRLTRLGDLRLKDNSISDLAPLAANAGLDSGDRVDVRGNPLNAASINLHIPALEARGVSVSFDETIVFTDPRIYNDNVFVLPVTENLAAGNLPLDEYAKRFYTYFSDAFDFLVFFSSLPRSQLDADAFKGAYHAGVANDVKGIGKGMFFNDRWGSAGKLQSVLFFSHVSVSNWEHSRLVQGPMLHELMHRWANFIVGPAVPHWDFTSADGILGGFNIANLVDHGGGRYSAPDVHTGGWAANVKRYSPIELYLAGLIPPGEVPDLWVAEDGEIVKTGRGDAPDDFTASRVRTVTIEDIIAEHGTRVPDHTQSQKAFRAAVILLVSQDYPAVRKSLEMLSNDATLFSHAGEDQFDDWYNFFEGTGGRATIAMDGLSQFKGSSASKRPAVRSFGTPPPPIESHEH